MPRAPARDLPSARIESTRGLYICIGKSWHSAPRSCEVSIDGTPRIPAQLKSLPIFHVCACSSHALRISQRLFPILYCNCLYLLSFTISKNLYLIFFIILQLSSQTLNKKWTTIKIPYFSSITNLDIYMKLHPRIFPVVIKLVVKASVIFYNKRQKLIQCGATLAHFLCKTSPAKTIYTSCKCLLFTGICNIYNRPRNARMRKESRRDIVSNRRTWSFDRSNRRRVHR